jgi:excisionase family DNA binding protein
VIIRYNKILRWKEGYAMLSIMANEEKRLLTVPEACAYLSISRMSLYRLFRNKEIIPVTLVGRTLVDRADLDQLVERAKGQDVGVAKRRGRKPKA